MTHPRWSAASTCAALAVGVSALGLAPTPAQAAVFGRTADLHVVATGAGTVSLDWADVAGAPGYRVRFATSRTMSGSKGKWFRTSAGTISGLRPGATYWFRSAVARPTGYALGPYTAAPYVSAVPTYAAPSGLRTTAAPGATSATVTWNAVSGAPGYRVRWSRSATLSGAATRWTTSRQLTLAGLTAGTTYYVQVAVARSTGANLGPVGPTLPVVTTPTAPVVTSPPPTPGSYDLHTATFNISTVNADGKDAPHEPWSVRKPVVARQILGLSPANETSPSADVVALQEASPSRTNGTMTQFQDLLASLNAMKAGDERYLGVPGSSQATHIAYDDTRVQLVTSGVLTWAQQETAVDPIRSMPWAIFQVRSTGARFFFASAHLETASESIRRAQWGELLAKVPGLSQGLPTIFGGDFNSPRGGSSQCPTPSNPTASVMLPKMAPAGYADTLGQAGCGKDLISTSRAASVVNGNINSVNWWSRNIPHYDNTDWIGQQVDYLFASNYLRVKRWELVVDQRNYVFQGVMPSDHNMLRATIVLPPA